MPTVSGWGSFLIELLRYDSMCCTLLLELIDLTALKIFTPEHLWLFPLSQSLCSYFEKTGHGLCGPP